ncbi:MAG: NADPH-dependent FMN reductase [bacterium]
MKNVLFIVGSMRERSFNRQLANVAEEMIADRCNVKYLDYSDLPYMNQDLEMPVQPVVARVRKEVVEADALWIFTPEYNFGCPGVLKNLLDWLSRPIDMSNFQNPSAALGKKVAVSGCGGKNMTQSCRAKLTELLDFMKMDLMHEPQTGIALGLEAWTKGEFLLTDDQRAELQRQADAFCKFIDV